MIDMGNDIYDEPPRGQHNVEIDRSGWRLTCRTCGEATAVRQPYMTETMWSLTVSVFQSYHPFDFESAMRSLERRGR